MAIKIRRVEYFYATVKDESGAAYELLSQLERLGINLLAFTAIPMGPQRTQLALFPEEPQHMESEAKKMGLELDGPHPALLVQGDDELGVLARIHENLSAASVNVSASSGVADGLGRFGYVIYVGPEDYERAAAALEV
ncbi:MAG: hypothetical protein ABFS46_01335 [Myxococcota bacterium]